MKTAVIFFNLGAPEKPASVKPFLFNLFYDPYIIELFNPMRWALAKFISSKRAPIAAEIYDELGGGSPLLPNTEAQAHALEKILPDDHKVFIAMRYWHPMSDETVKAVKAWGAERIVLMTLYPQFSRSTTGSSMRVWDQACKRNNLDIPTHRVCCYPTHQGFIKASAELVAKGIKEAGKNKAEKSNTRVLFSAHGLPEKMIKAGDPYEWQVYETAKAILAELKQKDLDYVVCFQSQVGSLPWIKPATEDEIERAGKEGKNLVIYPLAFVSEHSETLIELDVEYKELAEEHGVKNYVRVPTVSTHPEYINALKDMVFNATERGDQPLPDTGKRLCPSNFKRCPCGSQ